jgi:hypothetical protein
MMRQLSQDSIVRLVEIAQRVLDSRDESVVVRDRGAATARNRAVWRGRRADPATRFTGNRT